MGWRDTTEYTEYLRKKYWFDYQDDSEEVDEFEEYTEADYLMDQAERQNQIEKDLKEVK